MRIKSFLLAALALLVGVLGWNAFVLPASSDPVPPLYTVETETNIPSSANGTVFSDCDSGDPATGGGYLTEGDPADVRGSWPYGGAVYGSTSWAVDVVTNSGSAYDIEVFVVCMDLGSTH